MKFDMQQVYNQIRDHLLKQNACSVDREFHLCRYRNDEGLKCAIGCLIPDNLYNEEIEGKGIGMDVMKYLMEEIYEDYNSLHANFLHEMQLIHDCYDVSMWEIHLKAIADKYKLQP